MSERRARPRRLVVKVGTSTLSHGDGKMNLRCIDLLARALSDIKNMGCEVILVTSGAIAAGMSRLNMTSRPEDLRLKQAAATVGQCSLMHIYDKFFGEYGHVTGQVLLTRVEVEDPVVRANLIGTFEALLKLGVVPVVNENDSVSHEEIETGDARTFGDNDNLSAVVATLVGADLLVLLTDIDGFYDSDPRENPGAKLIPFVRGVDESMMQMAGGAGSRRGTGGMFTKLGAARTAAAAGIDMVVASGGDPSILYQIYEGMNIGTYFKA